MPLYNEYIGAFEQTRAALRAGNAAAIGTIRVALAGFLPMPRTAALLGFYDAVDRCPLRARAHFDRMRLRRARTRRGIA
jgi:hypothetical protein